MFLSQKIINLHSYLLAFINDIFTAVKTILAACTKAVMHLSDQRGGLAAI